MPIYNYLQVVEQGNNKALIRKWGLFKSNFTTAFEEIQRQLVNRFGISESYMDVLEKRQEIACLQIDLHVTDDKFNKTLIGIAESELNELTNRKSSTTDEIKDYLEKYKGFHLSLHTITVAEWFGYVKNYSKQQKTVKSS
jgi:hypothetical protein